MFRSKWLVLVLGFALVAFYGSFTSVYAQDSNASEEGNVQNDDHDFGAVDDVNDGEMNNVDDGAVNDGAHNEFGVNEVDGQNNDLDDGDRQDDFATDNPEPSL